MAKLPFKPNQFVTKKVPFIRTCQECGFRQEARDPGKMKSESWREAKCSKCKSAALDYGSYESDDAEDWA